ncbi:glycosyltransferase family 2 protein [Paraburkholderia dilworthii]|uniref:Glycosyltransferase family 2 protein n=2 Tax=Paraburkholderia dilworthii TaxID=948106 RepID=A0ABW9DHW9_9BURK
MDITVSIIFHKEAAFAVPALASMKLLVSTARSAGLAVEAHALLDNADKLTTHIVGQHGAWLDAIRHVAHGDLGLTRNTGTQQAAGDYLAFIDGDDLWGAAWLTGAHTQARQEAAASRSIWHPDSIFYFYESDFDRHSTDRFARADPKSYHLHHRPSDAQGFNANALFLDNLWTANIFAHRGIYERFPYKALNRDLGLGIEDWSWNIETYSAGIAHRTVPDTVHLIRVKEAGSLGQSNQSSGLLPYLPDYAFPALGTNKGAR